MAYHIAVGKQFRLRAVRKACDGSRPGGDFSGIFARRAHCSGDQKAKDPDCTLVGVDTLRDPVHGAFRIAANRSELRSQIAVEVLPLRAGCHGGEIWLNRSGGLAHQ
jgi:hypothetical protein